MGARLKPGFNPGLGVLCPEGAAESRAPYRIPSRKGDENALDSRMPEFFGVDLVVSAHMNLQAYEVEFLETASQIPNDLWDDCFQPPAEGRWWYEALDQSSIEDQFTFLYALINHFGSPVGIAPAFFMDVPVDQVAPQQFLRLLRLVGKIMPSVLSQRTLFVGSPILDEGRVGLIPHVNRRDALLSLQLALETKADELRAP